MPLDLLPHHRALVEGSGISAEVAQARGYRSLTVRAGLERLGFAPSQRLVPTLLIPIHDVNGQLTTYQHRPDTPRVVAGKPLKYETARGSRMVLDVPPGARPWLAIPERPLFVTEGARKADSAVSRGLCCVALLGVFGWRGSNQHGGKVALADWEAVALNGRDTYITFDSDVMLKTGVHAALARFKPFLEMRHAQVHLVYLPPGPGGAKQGLDDFFAAGGSVADLVALGTDELRRPPEDVPASLGTHVGSLPVIDLGVHRRLTERTAAALVAATRADADGPRVYQRGGVLVRLRVDEAVPCVEAFTPDALRGELDRAAIWISPDGDTVAPPLAVVRDILSLPGYECPRLRAVVEAPFFTEAGHLVLTRGYHPDAGVYVRPPEGLSIPAIPEMPSRADCHWARTLLLDEWLGDFPFVDAASRAHALGLLLLPFMRDLIDGPTPLHAVDAPMPGTGMGLLVDMIAIVATGRHVEVTTETTDQEELRKRITALLLAGPPFALLDNVRRRLDAGGLAALLTAPTWSDRILGASRMVHLPTRTTWIVTGNNVEVSPELARRTAWIRMDARMPMPHRRTRFRHDPLGTWTRERRGELLWAVLVLVRYWLAQGRPPFSARRLGSYESWAALVGGVLMAAGIQGFLENQDALSVHGDAEATAWQQFVEAWWHTFGDRAVDTAGLYPLAAEALQDVLGDGGDRSQHIRLGKALARRDGWVFAVGSEERREHLRLERTELPDAQGRTHAG